MQRLIVTMLCAAMASACSSGPDESATPPSNAHDLSAAEPGDEVAFTAFDERGIYATVTIERGDEARADAGVPDFLRNARYIAIRVRYDILASRPDMAIGQTNWYLYQPTRDGRFHPVGSGVIDRQPELPAFAMPVAEGEPVEGWLRVEVTEDRLLDDLYMAYSDSGPFPDDCCVPDAPRTLADTDGLVLIRRGES